MNPYRGYGTPPCLKESGWVYHNSFRGGVIIGLTAPLFLLWPIFFLKHTWKNKSRKYSCLDWVGLFFFLVLPLLQWFSVWGAAFLKGPGAYRFRHPLLRYDLEETCTAPTSC